MRKLLTLISVTAAMLAAVPSVSYAETLEIAAICYHSVSDSPLQLSEYRISDEELESDLSYFASNGYTFLKPNEMYNASAYDNNIVLTFDDGYDDFYDVVFPLLQKYNAKAVVYVIGSRIDKTGYLKSWQIKALDESGLVEIGNHTNIIHYYPYTSSDYADNTVLINDFIEDVKDCSNKIYRITGHGTESLAYPSGHYTWTMDSVLKTNLGYTTTFTTDHGIVYGRSAIADPMNRIYRMHGESTWSLINKINKCK